MRRLLVCQHVPWELLGTLDPLLRRSGFRIRFVNFGRHPDARPDVDAANGLVLLGGPMNVDETRRHPHLLTELHMIERALDRGIPVLGICLGAQLLAKALGAPVTRGPVKEIGWYDVTPTPAGAEDPLIGHFDGTERIFQWHGDTFDLPSGAEHLATGSPVERQAFRYGERAYGFQFHLEVDEPMVRRWLTVPGNVEEIRQLHGEIDPKRILVETRRHVDRLQTLADRVFGGFVDLFGLPEKNVHLPSR